jgi:hypothetical protein
MVNDWKKIAKTIPCFTKKNLINSINGSIDTFNDQIQASIKKGEIFKLKNGLYMFKDFFNIEPQKTELSEYIAGQLKNPSYLSMEYVMQNYGLLTEAIYITTSVTKKSRKIYRNFLGTFKYSNIKDDLYFGFEKKNFGKNVYYEANKAKAVFDYLYLKRNIASKLKEEILEGLRINWIGFSREDFDLFNSYCVKSRSKKMLRIASILKNNIYK